MPSAPPDPNFRQLSRVSGGARPQGTIGPSNLPDDQSGPIYSPFGDGAALDLLRMSQMQQNQYRPGPTEGIDYDVLTRLITGHESGNRPPDVKNPDSSATGRGQFIEDTWLDMLARHRPDIKGLREQLLALRSDAKLSTEMTKAYARDNAQILRRAGFPVTPGNIYLAHFAGPTGSKAVLRADPSTPVESLLKKDALDANTKNPNLRTMNAGELRAWADHAVAVQAKRLENEKRAAFQSAISVPQQPLPAYPLQTPPSLPFSPQPISLEPGITIYPSGVRPIASPPKHRPRD